MRIRDAADPLSEEGQKDPDKVILARSESLRLLHQDLARYCDARIQGRSVLISGHRGSGKTTLVADAIREARSWKANPSTMRPLPVFLHGPSLLETWPSDIWRMTESLKRKDGSDEKQVPATSEASLETRVEEGGQKLAGVDSRKNSPQPAKPTKQVSTSTAPTSLNNSATPPIAPTREQWLKEAHAWTALEHIILGIHRAVTREFVTHYREFVHEAELIKLEPESGEMAAAFEIELLEDPAAWRLREFWDRAGAMERGVLFRSHRPHDQGARELAALNGICNAHQRISGEMSGESSEKRELARQRETTRGFDFKAVDALKPLGAVIAGAAVTTSTAISTNGLLAPALLGLVTAWASAYFLKSTRTETSKRERIVDRTFIPDLSIRTLDRIIPFLVDRLRAAGLAPVFVIDELDKVNELGDCIDNLAAYLKKLVSENVFSCFMADRGYLEYLTRDPDEKRFGRKSSMFSPRLLVSYCPWDFDEYLSRLIVLDDNDQAGAMGAVQAGGARADREVLKWVLRHRSQLHALNLRREVDALASGGDRLAIEPGALRTDYQSRIDLTLQMAIELTFYSKEAVGWLERQAFAQQTLVDALYWLSRMWLAGDPRVDTSRMGKQELNKYLVERMAIDDISKKFSESISTTAAALSADDKDTLGRLVDSIVAFLSPGNTPDLVRQRWAETISRMKWQADAMPMPAVMEALLLGSESLLVPDDAAVDTRNKNKWRYFRSGLPRDDEWNQSQGSDMVPAEVWTAIDWIEEIGDKLQGLFLKFEFPGSTDAFGLLGDGWHVIPTTPAWRQVKSSISNLRAVRVAAGNMASIAQDCRNVTDFHRVLSDSDEVIASFLWCGIVLGADWSDS